MPPTKTSWFSRLSGRRVESVPPDARDIYEFAPPSNQNAIDLLPGWNHAFPDEHRLNAGAAHMYNDPRILWAAEQFGAFAGKRILELGPLEGSHTMMLERLGARRVDAMEGNKLAFLRCLVAKEIYDLRRSHFHLGDFVRGLSNPTRYDMIVACGVLYHMRDPLLLLERMAARSNCLYIWTHYFDDLEMPRDDLRRPAFRALEPPNEEVVETVSFHGVDMRLHLRSYYQAWRNSQYCGGPVDQHFWLEKAQLIAALGALGFNKINLAHEEPQHVNGPAMSIFARRT